MTQEPSEQVEKVEPMGIPDYGRKQENGRGNQLKQLIPPLVISVIVAFGMMQGYFMPQIDSKLDTKIELVNTELDSIKTSLIPIGTQLAQLNGSINSLGQDIAGVKGSLGNYATVGSVSGFQASISSIQSDLNGVKSTLASIPASVTSVQTSVTSLQSTVNGLQTSLNSLQTSVTALTTRVTALEIPASGGGGGSISGTPFNVKLTVLDEGTFNSSDNSSTASIKLVVTNNSTVDVEDLIMSVRLYVDANGNPALYTLSGDDSWYIKSTQSQTAEIRNKRGTILKAGKTWKFYLDLKTTYDSASKAESATLEDYEIEIMSYD